MQYLAENSSQKTFKRLIWSDPKDQNDDLSVKTSPVYSIYAPDTNNWTDLWSRQIDVNDYHRRLGDDEIHIMHYMRANEIELEEND